MGWVVPIGVSALGFVIGIITGLFLGSRPAAKDLLLNIAAILAVIVLIVVWASRYAEKGPLSTAIWFLPIGLAVGLLWGLNMVFKRLR